MAGQVTVCVSWTTVLWLGETESGSAGEQPGEGSPSQDGSISRLAPVAFVAGWPSLLQAGCAAQETSARTLNKNGRSTPQNVNSKFLVTLR